jgi:hypothetical protein
MRGRTALSSTTRHQDNRSRELTLGMICARLRRRRSHANILNDSRNHQSRTRSVRLNRKYAVLIPQGSRVLGRMTQVIMPGHGVCMCLRPERPAIDFGYRLQPKRVNRVKITRQESNQTE